MRDRQTYRQTGKHMHGQAPRFAIYNTIDDFPSKELQHRKRQFGQLKKIYFFPMRGMNVIKKNIFFSDARYECN